jgi:TP901 family phage tail tape measure protein
MPGRFTVETVFKGTDNTSGVISSIEKRARAMERGLHGPVGFADKGIEGFKKVGAVAAVAGAAAGVAFGHLIETGADFEQSITNVGAVMGKSRGQIAELEKAALSLGVTTQFSSSEVSEAMEQMARKGFDSEEILAGIPGVLNAIAASGEGMAEVATVVGSAIRGFGLDAKDASHVADVLAFSAEKTGAHITDMGSALSTVAPTARALGVSIEDAAASVGLLQKMGIDASTAGSATATMLAKISHPSKEAAQKMTAMGIAFKDAKGNMLPFRDVLGQFVKAGDKAGGNMDRMSFFAELVGLRGDKAALALSDMAKSGDFDKLVAGLKNVDGYSEKVAKIRMDTTKGSWKLLTSTVEVLETKLFDLNGGGLKGAIDKTNAWVSANQDLIISGAAEYADKLVHGIEFLVDNIDTGITLLDNFKDGLVAAFEDSTSVKVFGAVLASVFGGDDKNGPRIQAYELGKNIGDAVDKFILFTGIVKTAQFAVWGFANMAKIAKTAMWAWEAATTAVKWATVAVGAAEVETAGLTVGFGAAMTEASVGAGELALAEEGVTAGLVEVEAAAVGAEAGIVGIGAAAATAAIPLIAAAAALAAVYNAKKFLDENGGEEGLKGFFGLNGQGGGKEGVDAVMNQQAHADLVARRLARGDNADGSPKWGAGSAAGAASDLVGGNPGGKGQWAGAFGIGAPGARPPGPYADGYVSPAATPQVVPMRDQQSDAAAKTNQQLNDTLRQLVPQLSGAMKGTLTIRLPKGATGEVAGAPGVNVQPSGSFD